MKYEEYLINKNEELLDEAIKLYEFSIEAQTKMLERQIKQYKKDKNKKKFKKNIIKCSLVLNPEKIEEIFKNNSINDIEIINTKKILKTFLNKIMDLKYIRINNEEQSNEIKKEIQNLISIEDFENLFSFPIIEKLEDTNLFYFKILINLYSNSEFISLNLESNKIIYKEILTNIESEKIDCEKIYYLTQLSLGEIDNGNAKDIISSINDNNDHAEKLEKDFEELKNYFSIEKNYKEKHSFKIYIIFMK